MLVVAGELSWTAVIDEQYFRQITLNLLLGIHRRLLYEKIREYNLD